MLSNGYFDGVILGIIKKEAMQGERTQTAGNQVVDQTRNRVARFFLPSQVWRFWAKT